MKKNIEIINMLKRDGLYVQTISFENQTQEIKLSSVKQNGYALKFIKEQNFEICLEAVKTSALSFQFVKKECLDKEEYEIIYETAVKKNKLVKKFYSIKD